MKRDHNSLSCRFGYVTLKSKSPQNQDHNSLSFQWRELDLILTDTTPLNDARRFREHNEYESEYFSMKLQNNNFVANRRIIICQWTCLWNSVALFFRSTLLIRIQSYDRIQNTYYIKILLDLLHQLRHYRSSQTLFRLLTDPTTPTCILFVNCWSLSHRRALVVIWCISSRREEGIEQSCPRRYEVFVFYDVFSQRDHIIEIEYFEFWQHFYDDDFFSSVWSANSTWDSTNLFIDDYIPIP